MRRLESLATFARSIDSSTKTAKRGLDPAIGDIPLRVHRVGGSLKIEVAEADAWTKAGCPAASEWTWPNEETSPLRVASG